MTKDEIIAALYDGEILTAEVSGRELFIKVGSRAPLLASENLTTWHAWTISREDFFQIAWEPYNGKVR